MSTPTLKLLESASLVSQGAEAKAYKAILHPQLVASPRSSRRFAVAPGSIDSESDTEVVQPVTIFLKYRFAKQYRHATLDAGLTRARVAGEARALMRCLRSGVNVPALRMVDAPAGVLGIEWIEGHSVRFLLGGGDEGELSSDEDDAGTSVDATEDNPLKNYGVSQDDVMDMIGSQIGKMHQADVIHGDLTTSNMMLRLRMVPLEGLSPSELLLIDFGLAYNSTLVEDKAVDLYVLERAFSSTHPESEPLFARVLDAYGRQLGKKEWTKVETRLKDVRLRGRKRSMVG